MNWISTLVGFLVFTFLMYARQFVWVLAILASAGTFCLYFPPIPAYNFAAYLLLVFAFISALDRLNGH
jgi:Gpi18-like mannosyltransferase